MIVRTQPSRLFTCGGLLVVIAHLVCITTMTMLLLLTRGDITALYSSIRVCSNSHAVVITDVLNSQHAYILVEATRGRAPADRLLVRKKKAASSTALGPVELSTRTGVVLLLPRRHVLNMLTTLQESAHSKGYVRACFAQMFIPRSEQQKKDAFHD